MQHRFSIVTPSHNMLDGLQLCAASIADQAGVMVQHIIQDNCSPGIEKARPQLEKIAASALDYSQEIHSEPDSGIYQAVNRGLDRSRHHLLAYLNCDEQYLPGALEKVAQFFAAHPDVDVVFGDLVFIDNDGDPIHYQKTILPRAPIIQVDSLPTFTCATFFRRRVFERFRFREDLKAVADAYWILDLLKSGTKIALLHEPTSAFTCGDSNYSDSQRAQDEKSSLKRSAPAWQRHMSFLLKASHKAEKALNGCYTFSPFDYRIYRPGKIQRTLYYHGSRR